MKNKKKIIIAGSCTIIILVIFLFVINFGLRMGYVKKTRKLADMWFETNVDKDEKPGKLEYLYAMYNKDLDLFEVTYYAKLGNSMIGDSDWLQLCVPLSGDTKSVGVPEIIYCPEDYYEEYIARPNSVTVMEDERGEWERVDRIKGQGFINGICILALLTISGFILFYSKEDIKNILSGSNKENENSFDISDRTLINTESTNINLNRLKELTLMKENGLITEEEFEIKKRDIIDKM